MALKISYTTKFGIDLPEAYVHIASFSGDKSQIQVSLTVYKDKDAKDTKKVPVEPLRATLKIPFGATMAQMYTELKKQDPFKLATDI